MGGLETAAAEDEFATEKDLENNFYPLKGYTFIFDQRKYATSPVKSLYCPTPNGLLNKSTIGLSYIISQDFFAERYL